MDLYGIVLQYRTNCQCSIEQNGKQFCYGIFPLTKIEAPPWYPIWDIKLFHAQKTNIFSLHAHWYQSTAECQWQWQQCRQWPSECCQPIKSELFLVTDTTTRILVKFWTWNLSSYCLVVSYFFFSSCHIFCRPTPASLLSHELLYNSRQPCHCQSNTMEHHNLHIDIMFCAF
jgi:hypothetical protein